MDTTCVDATTIRSATAVADARETTRAFLEALRQPAVDSEAAGIDPPDALIAATALANGWTVATSNIKHMARTGALVVNPLEQQL
ncbi:PIN domain-containing protein [Streptomyces hirsutus]|uniref:hypothetical protein n=1 Tax=Streptomyces hirsutus TaxID=35620 RepID=UPI0036828365